MQGMPNYFNQPTTMPGHGPREAAQDQIDRLRKQEMSTWTGTGGIGLDRLPAIGRQIQDLEAQRDLHCPAPSQPASYNPMLNAAGTTHNLSSALGATERSSGSYPVWLMAHTGLFE